MAKAPKKASTKQRGVEPPAREGKSPPPKVSFGRTGYTDYGVDPSKGRKPKRR